MRSVPWDLVGLRQAPAVSFISIWQHQLQDLLQGPNGPGEVRRQPLGARPWLWESASGQSVWTQRLGVGGVPGELVEEEVGDRGSSSTRPYRELQVFNRNLESASFTTLLGQSP